MRPRTRALLVFLVMLVGSAGCDHASKQVALSTLSGAGLVSVAGGAIRLELASNPGAFLSLGAGLPEAVRHLVLLVLVPLGLLVLCAGLLRALETSTGLAVGVGLVAGGGLANWLDRLLHDGAVTDFVVVALGPLRTGVFNLADVAIVCGAVLLVTCARGRAAAPVPGPPG